MSWMLRALSEPIQGQTLTIDRNMVIGRHQQADIVLQASHVSRRHAHLLLREDGTLWVEDLGSSNGTFVNQKRITLQQLQDQDKINFEEIIFEVVENTASAHQQSIEQQDISEIEKSVPGDSGMPTLQERGDVQIDPQGMPTNVGVPKPAPIPENIDIKASNEPKAVPLEQPTTRVEKVEQEQKNAKVGLISIITILILIVIAAIFYMGN